MRSVVPGHARHGSQVSRQAVQVFGIDRVALKRHRAAAYLLGAKGLAPLADGRRLQQSQVVGHAVDRLRQPGQRVEDQPVLLARVNLRAD